MLTIVAAIVATIPMFAQPLDFSKTLRLNYIFSGTDKDQSITLAELCSIEGWAGKRVNLDKVPVRGNGQLTLSVRSAEGADFDKVIYKTSFSTLFQEWQPTEEATKLAKGFENVFLAPMPSEETLVTVELFDFKDGHVSCSYSHVVDPKDILIRPVGMNPAPYEWIWKGGEDLASDPKSDERIDVAIVAEGYTEAEMETFMADAKEAMASLWAHEPFKSMSDRFNLVCVKSPSKDSGVSVPREGLWKETAVGSNFDSFYTERYLTTPVSGRWLSMSSATVSPVSLTNTTMMTSIQSITIPMSSHGRRISRPCMISTLNGGALSGRSSGATTPLSIGGERKALKKR